MKIKILRYDRGDVSTMGLMFINDKFFGHVLENPWLDNERKISCIPTGKYKIGFRSDPTSLTMKYRSKFDWFNFHIEILGVPDRTGIYIHLGNSSRDTYGCPLVGSTSGADFIGQSTVKYTAFYEVVSTALKAGEPVAIEIVDQN